MMPIEILAIIKAKQIARVQVLAAIDAKTKRPCVAIMWPSVEPGEAGLYTCHDLFCDDREAAIKLQNVLCEALKNGGVEVQRLDSPSEMSATAPGGETRN
jgi:hypothetical protein